MAATQGRALWVLDDIAPLRQASQTVAREAVHLFTPEPATRVRGDNNRDTPAPPEEPVGAHPPAGAIIDYWLSKPAKGPVVLEIADSAGRLVQRITSDPSKPPPAEVYFANRWLAPARPLATDAGLHRAIWNLRYARPNAISYEYSMAVAGRGSEVEPGGPYAPPGDYRVTLKVDGQSRSAPLILTQDPRTGVSAADFQASLALSLDIDGKLALAWRGYAETTLVHAELTAAVGALTQAKADPALVARAGALTARTAQGAQDPSFTKESRILAGIESDLESSDLPPTQAQHDAAVGAGRSIDTLYGDWSRLRDEDLATLNRALSGAGAKTVILPPPGDLAVDPPEGGEDLP